MLTIVNENEAGVKMSYESKINNRCGHYNPFLSKDERVKTVHGVHGAVNQLLSGPAQPKFSNTNPFVDVDGQSYGSKEKWPTCRTITYAKSPTPCATIKAAPRTRCSHRECCHSTYQPFLFCPLEKFNIEHTSPMLPPLPHMPELNAPPKDVTHEHFVEPENVKTVQLKGSLHKCEQFKIRAHCPYLAFYQSSSESEEENDYRERVPTLRPGQYDGMTPGKDFLYRFESCAYINH